MNTFHFSLSSFKCLVVQDFSGDPLPLSSVFPIVAEDEMDRLLASGEYQATLPRQGNVLLIDTGRQKVLIDSGLPAERQGELVQNLADEGVNPSDIETIIVTHGDGDHIGGLDRFPQARIVMPENSWRLWTEHLDNMIEEFVGLFRGQVPEAQLTGMIAGRRKYGLHLQAIAERVDRVDFNKEVIPGFRLLAAPGHRSDHTAVEITDGDYRLLHIVDAFRHPLQMTHPWPSWIDSYPQQTVATAQMLFQQAAETGSLVFGSHLPFPGLVRISRDDAGYAWEPLMV